MKKMLKSNYLQSTKNGFTLIELLAVIVILAIILSISTLLIINIINNIKRETFKINTYEILKAAEIGYMREMVKGNTVTSTLYEYIDGDERKQGNIEINYHGDKPQNGKIAINDEGEVAIAIYQDGYCALKEYHDRKIVLIKQEQNECEIPLPSLPPMAPTKFETIDKIRVGKSEVIKWDEPQSWGSSENNRNYRLEISYDDAEYELLVNTLEISSYEITVPDDKIASKYKLRVRSETESGVSDWVYSEEMEIYDWVVQNISKNNYIKIKYANGTWIALGNKGLNGLVSVSNDGLNWETKTLGPSGASRFNDIFYYNNRWVIVGESGQVLTSTDNGTTWDIKNIGSREWKAVYCVSGRWIIAGVNGVGTSTNGTSWSIQELTYINQAGSSVAFNGADITHTNGRWVIGGYNAIATSTNGTSWVTKLIDSSTSISTFKIYGYGNRFVLIPDASGTRIYTSTNGTTWTAVGGSGSMVWRSVIYFNNNWIVGGSERKIQTSTDGVNWTTKNATVAPLSSLTFNKFINDKNYLISYTSSNLAISLNANDWIVDKMKTSPSDISYNDGVWVTVSSSGDIATLKEDISKLLK